MNFILVLFLYQRLVVILLFKTVVMFLWWFFLTQFCVNTNTNTNTNTNNNNHPAYFFQLCIQTPAGMFISTYVIFTDSFTETDAFVPTGKPVPLPFLGVLRLCLPETEYCVGP